VEDRSTESSASAAERHPRKFFLQALPLGGSEDSVSRLTSKKNRSFSASASLDCRPASIKSMSTRLALVFRVLAKVRTRFAIPAGIETL
jgi:hypothetical protein